MPLLEIGLIGSTVFYLHRAHGDVPFDVLATSSTPQFGLCPKPAHLLVDQGHMSNGAAGTAIFLVCIPGFLFLNSERHVRTRSHNALDHFQDVNNLGRRAHTWTLRSVFGNRGTLYRTWVFMTVVSFLLTLTALIFTFIVTQQSASTRSQINLHTAAALDVTGKPQPYPDKSWTPENWYKAVIALPFVDDSQKADIKSKVMVMSIWRWNLIPMLFLSLVTASLAILSYRNEERAGAHVRKKEADGEKGTAESIKGEIGCGKGEAHNGGEDASGSEEDPDGGKGEVTY